MSRHKAGVGTPAPKTTWPELRDWQSTGMHDAVFRAIRATGDCVYVRADDGSGLLLRRLEDESDIPAPRLLDQRDGWLVLEALPGAPLNDARWRARPDHAVQVVADGLMVLERNEIRHGDMCLPNILGDLVTGDLSGIVDWHYAGQFGREIDVASAIWSCEYNGYTADVPVAVLRLIGWPSADPAEVERLSRVWIDVAGQPDKAD